MGKHFGLSDVEYDLMSFFWEQAKPVTFAEILNFCNSVKGWNWAKTTAHTYVTRLMQKGLLDMNSVRGVRRTYFARINREDFARKSAQEFIDSSFSGSLKNLFLTLVPDNKLTQEDIHELRKVLDQLIETNDDAST